MKIVIFCGGLATRFNNGKPGPLKPLIKIKGKTILERIMDLYKDVNNPEFILLGGYKFNELKNFCKNFKKYKVIPIDTGKLTPTGGRLLKIKKLVGNKKFFLTYGDSLINYDPKKSINNKKKFIISIYNYKIPYGVVYLDNKKKYIKNFLEKKYEIFINAGFFYLDSCIFNYIFSLNESFEHDVLPRVIKSRIKSHKVSFVETDNWFTIDNKYDLDTIIKSKLIK